MGTKKDSAFNTLHIFSNKNNVYFTNNNLKETDWSPINFHWIPVQKLQEELNYSNSNLEKF